MRKIASVALPPALDNLPRFIACVSQAARGQGLGERVGQVELAVEEAVTNICKYGGAPGAAEVEIVCLAGPAVLVVEISDRGRPFDMTVWPAPDVKADVAQRPIGGLGVFLIKKVTDAVEYRREGGRNVLRLTFRNRFPAI